MTDEPETPDEDDPQIGVETTAEPEWYEVEGGYIIAPRGFANVQDHFGCPLVRINMKAPGSVDVLVSDDGGESWKWKSVDRVKVTAQLTALK